MATLIPDAGENLFADVLQNVVSPPTNYFIGWGTGSGQGEASTTLAAEAAESRATASKSQPSSNIMRFVGTITASAGRAITEAGLFDASTSGNMCLYGDFTVINLVSGDAIEFTIDITIT